MKYRKLRIVFSVTCGIACVLLVVLWVRSNWYVDSVMIPNAPRRATLIESFKGRMLVTEFGASSQFKWRLFSEMSDAEFPNAIAWSYVADFDPLSNGRVIPYWPAAIAAAVLASGPWFAWSHRFSLRTLLITITLVALALGLIIATTR